MKKYETFNPAIPELEESSEQEQEQEQPQEEAKQPKPEINELPPFKEDPPAPVNNNKIRTEKRVKPKKPINKPKPKPKPEPKKVVREPKEPGPPLTEVIKAWAQSQTTRWLLGLFLGFLGLYLGVSFLTYLTTCVKDQSEVHNVAIGAACDISNAGGEGGARL
ncbi:MAG: hypothetical protein K2H60_16200 [Muribaculaceae bacterium]|nr:hypothetical protein [Muribaculaceae bacterium]